MDYFKPPTDNLYKFIAVAGLLLFAVSYIWPIRFAYDTNAKTLDIVRRFNARQSASLDLQVDELAIFTPENRRALFESTERDMPSAFSHSDNDREKWRESLLKRIHHFTLLLHSATYEKLETDLQKPEYRPLLRSLGIDNPTNVSPDNIWSGVEVLRASAMKARNEEMQRLYDLEEIWRANDTASHWNWQGAIGCVLGVLFAFAGFGCWYFIVQQHQDTILLNEAGRAATKQDKRYFNWPAKRT